MVESVEGGGGGWVEDEDEDDESGREVVAKLMIVKLVVNSFIMKIKNKIV